MLLEQPVRDASASLVKLDTRHRVLAVSAGVREPRRQQLQFERAGRALFQARGVF
jgi:hypothetical protein